MEAKMLSAKALPIYAATVAAALSLMLTGCGQGSGAPTPTPGTGQAEQKQAAPASPKPEEKPDPDDPQVTGLPRADYDGSRPSGIYKGIPPTPPDPADFPGMNENTDAGAIQTLKYWDTAYNYAIATGNVSYARKHSAPTCTTCTELLENIIKRHKEGAYGKGRVIEHFESEVKVVDGVKGYYIYGQSHGFTLVKLGKSNKPDGYRTYLRLATMEHDGAKWNLSEMDYKFEEGRR
ncbi:DUF6318 family protein [Dermabacteraceae bacterium P13077]